MVWQGPGRVKDFVLAVMRETYGWSAKSRVIPEYRFSALLGISGTRVRQLRAKAEACGMILRTGNEYEVQKDYSLWTVPDGVGLAEDAQRVLRRGYFAEGGAQCAEGTAQAVLAEDENSGAEGTAVIPQEGTALEDGALLIEDVKASSKAIKDSASHDDADTPTALFGDDDVPVPVEDRPKTTRTRKQKAEPEDTPPADPRGETPAQLAIRAAWEAFGIEGTPRGKGYSGFLRIISETGTQAVYEWADYIRAVGKTVPEGADPVEFFKAQFMAAMPVKVQFTWRNDPAAKLIAATEPVINCNGTMRRYSAIVSSDALADLLQPTERRMVMACFNAGDWDNRTGDVREDAKCRWPGL